MRSNYFHMIVKKIWKTKKQIITIDELKRYIKSILLDEYSDSRFYKYVYFLKNRGYILSIKKNLFYLKKNPELEENLDDIIDKFYWNILKNHIQDNFGNKYFIWWVKALEIIQNNFSIPEEINVINPYKNSKQTIVKNRFINNKVYSSKTHKNLLFYNKIKKWSQILYINWVSFKVCSPEQAVLEALYSMKDTEQNYIMEIIRKFMRKNHKKLNYNMFTYYIRLWKYHSSINKLYQISKSLHPSLEEKLKEIIKRTSFLL